LKFVKDVPTNVRNMIMIIVKSAMRPVMNVQKSVVN